MSEYSETCVCGAGMSAIGNPTFIRMQRESFHFRHKDCSSTPVPGSSRMSIHPLYAGGSVGMPSIAEAKPYRGPECVRCCTRQQGTNFPQWVVRDTQTYCRRCATEMG